MKNNKQKKLLKHTCVTCHFLITEYLNNPTIGPNKMEKQSLSPDRRLRIKDLAKCYKENRPS